ncbi:HPF/RaiA family ribosome-associated protein [Nocardia fluminea]|uniref:HPF/RaiA family ribosome-associated protein n=1 Tax=Nocardia fluminea TaxID=134984 RepID=UPI003811607D
MEPVVIEPQWTGVGALAHDLCAEESDQVKQKESTMLQSAEPTDAVVRISVGHHVSATAAEYARERIGWALRYESEPILSVRVRLTGHGDPAVRDPIVAQANVNMGGRAVRAQVTAATTREAGDRLADRVRARLERLSRQWEASRGSRFGQESPTWHHGAAHRRRVPMTTSAAAAPVLGPEAAAERLELTGRPFVFFRDPELNKNIQGDDDQHDSIDEISNPRIPRLCAGVRAAPACGGTAVSEYGPAALPGSALRSAHRVAGGVRASGGYRGGAGHSIRYHALVA